jgi:Arc/MetJ family transcription regulator
MNRCRGAIVVTSLNINDALLQEALALNDQTTVDALVETALREYIQRRKQLKVLDLFGTIDYDPDYDYKQQRQPA